MSQFITHLDMELMWDDKGLPLCNRDGRQLYQLLSDFVYRSDVAARLIVVPKGFVTDLASIPQIMLSLLGEVAQEPSVPHDFLYSTTPVTREVADKVLLEAMLLTGVSNWKAQSIYLGVRVGGGSHYGTK